MWQVGATLHRGARASHYRGLSCCGAQAPDAQAQQLWLTGLVTPWHVGSSQTRARTRVPCIGRRTLNHCATREAPIMALLSASVEHKLSRAEGSPPVIWFQPSELDRRCPEDILPGRQDLAMSFKLRGIQLVQEKEVLSVFTHCNPPPVRRHLELVLSRCMTGWLYCQPQPQFPRE